MFRIPSCEMTRAGWPCHWTGVRRHILILHGAGLDWDSANVLRVILKGLVMCVRLERWLRIREVMLLHWHVEILSRDEGLVLAPIDGIIPTWDCAWRRMVLLLVYQGLDIASALALRLDTILAGLERVSSVWQVEWKHTYWFLLSALDPPSSTGCINWFQSISIEGDDRVGLTQTTSFGPSLCGGSLLLLLGGGGILWKPGLRFRCG